MKRVRKKNSYDSYWLWYDVDIMGYLFQRCHEYEFKLYNTEIDITKFCNAFLKSDCRKALDMGLGCVITYASQEIFQMFIDVDLDGDMSSFLVDADGKQSIYEPIELLWAGQAYAYVHYELDLPMTKVVEVIPFEDMISYFPTGHQLGWKGFCDRLKWKFGVEDDD